jgi:arylsulfatase A-like enzyme
MLFSQGNFAKGQPYEESIHVPFFLRYPDAVPAGSEPEAFLSTVDLAQTLCSLADLDETIEDTALPDAQGTNLAPTLRGEEQETPESVYLGIHKVQDQSIDQGMPEFRGVRTERYTYARLPGGEPWVLYDNEADPYQLENLAIDGDAAEVRERLDALVEEWIERTGDRDVDGEELLRELDIVEEWNARERELSPEDPGLID